MNRVWPKAALHHRKAGKKITPFPNFFGNSANLA
jgi:hypothetical protein